MSEEIITEKKPRGFVKFASLLPVKLLSFMAIIIFSITTIIGTIAIIDLADYGLYNNNFNAIAISQFRNVARLNANMVSSYVQSNEIDEAKSFILQRNIAGIKISFTRAYDYEWEDIDDFEFYTDIRFKENPPLDYVIHDTDGYIEWTVFVDPALSKNDAYLEAFQKAQVFYDYRYLPIIGTVFSALLVLLNLIIYLTGIGRYPEKAGVYPNAATKIPFDLLTAVLGVFWFILACCAVEASYSSVEAFALVFVGIIIITFLLWFANLIHRLKLRNIFSNTLIWMGCKLIWKLLCNISLIWQAFLILSIVSLVEFSVIVLIGLMGREVTALIILFFWFIEKCFVIPILLYIVLMMKNIFKGGNEIASGNLDYKMNLKGLVGAYKKHGENLNNLSEVINKSVSEKMKSERMKSELITNVSHDLKTPLTSVINYSDLIRIEADNLIKNEAYNVDTTDDTIDNVSVHLANIEQYSEVLNRQSKKLKRLLEDLVDISKANSGNMEVFIEKINVTTILSQAAAEFDERFEQRNLEVIINNPEDPVYISADSRKIWRVFDNLLQNICKYAHPGTRVFLSTEDKGEKVEIIFKNTSDELITVSPDELTERFTRGDESRHKEGNGLGLAIAKSMTELQGGNLSIAIDGDLFKVILLMNKYVEEVKPEETKAEAVEVASENTEISNDTVEVKSEITEVYNETAEASYDAVEASNEIEEISEQTEDTVHPDNAS